MRLTCHRLEVQLQAKPGRRQGPSAGGGGLQEAAPPLRRALGPCLTPSTHQHLLIELQERGEVSIWKLSGREPPTES